MKDKINVAELLKDCPSGMELDCTAFNNVKFQCADNDGIWIEYIDSDNHDRVIYLTCEGGIKIKNIETKCIIFPKGKTTWEKFQRPFKDEDIVAVTVYPEGTWIGIFKQYEKTSFEAHCSLNTIGEYYIGSKNHSLTGVHLATEEEKAQLFQVIKDNGYKWNTETKTLEKLPKFKVGDRVKHISAYTSGIVVKVTDKGYHIDYPKGEGVCYVSFTLEKDYELASNKFNINTLRPFDKVLMRSSNAREWVATFYSHYSNNKFYGCGMCCDQCIPYEGNEHLLGTTDDCDEYFKTWK